MSNNFKPGDCVKIKLKALPTKYVGRYGTVDLITQNAATVRMENGDLAVFALEWLELEQIKEAMEKRPLPGIIHQPTDEVVVKRGGDFKDSGERSEFATGAVRDLQAGKGRYDLLPDRAIHELSLIFEKGAKKYGDRNWEKGITIASCINSARRHMAKFMMGWTDEPHLAMALWNNACAMDLLARIRDGVYTSEQVAAIWAGMPVTLEEALKPYPVMAK